MRRWDGWGWTELGGVGLGWVWVESENGSWRMAVGGGWRTKVESRGNTGEDTLRWVGGPLERWTVRSGLRGVGDSEVLLDDMRLTCGSDRGGLTDLDVLGG